MNFVQHVEARNEALTWYIKYNIFSGIVMRYSHKSYSSKTKQDRARTHSTTHMLTSFNVCLGKNGPII